MPPRKQSEAERKRKDKAYQSTPQQKKRRAARNRARRAAIKKFGKQALKGKDIDHKDGNPMNNSTGNLRVMNRKKNRGRNNGPNGKPGKSGH
jgi:hypothetical protein|tara:strand:- start:91 stop:366 length:276 start_codon:yes stop_codon:yes gene_type:complete